ncbi:hypothetical protein DIPPA_30221 [Diplonema papillatum]|nr:hypothetical protein DIPPA_30221 [Diplonema papillatum]
MSSATDELTQKLDSFVLTVPPPNTTRGGAESKYTAGVLVDEQPRHLADTTFTAIGWLWGKRFSKPQTSTLPPPSTTSGSAVNNNSPVV